jgi:hypothetical protein
VVGFELFTIIHTTEETLYCAVSYSEYRAKSNWFFDCHLLQHSYDDCDSPLSRYTENNLALPNYRFVNHFPRFLLPGGSIREIQGASSNQMRKDTSSGTRMRDMHKREGNYAIRKPMISSNPAGVYVCDSYAYVHGFEHRHRVSSMDQFQQLSVNNNQHEFALIRDRSYTYVIRIHVVGWAEG